MHGIGRAYEGIENAPAVELGERRLEYAARAAHELLVLLEAMVSTCEELRMGMADQLNDQQQLGCRDLVTIGRHLLSMVDEIIEGFERETNGQ